MNELTKRVMHQGLALNQRLSETAANSVDWLFKRDTLIKSGRTWFELVHDGDLMSVRYYELPEDDDIELVDGSRKPIQRQQHAVPLVLVPPLGVTTETFDLMPQRSLVRFMVAAGFKVYLIDWGKPKKEHAHLGLKDYSHDMMSTALEKVRRHSGSQGHTDQCHHPAGEHEGLEVGLFQGHTLAFLRQDHSEHVQRVVHPDAHTQGDNRQRRHLHPDTQPHHQGLTQD